MSDLVIATFNAKKGKEMEVILAEMLPGLKLHTLAEYPDSPEPEETGSTYAENASIKAISALKSTGLPSLSDDAGLEIDALDGAPGLYSKRFGGEDLSFDRKIEKLLGLLESTPEGKRTARFRCCIALALPDLETPIVFTAVCEGRIAERPSGARGFGYDSIFYLPERGCTMADLSSEAKNAVSHRGKVLRSFADYWRGTQ
jgi:XTP/dITP diphosphohydrolase